MANLSFQPQNTLEEALVRATTDAAHRPHFYQELIRAKLFIIKEGAVPKTSGSTTLEAGHELSIQTFAWNGKEYLPAFSSLPRLQAALRDERGYLALKALDLFEITRGADVFLNPGSEYGKELTKVEIASILDGSIWRPGERWVADKETHCLIGQPATYPHELTRALAQYFRQRKEVSRAYVAHFFIEGRDEKPHTLIGIETSGPWDPLSSGAGIVANSVAVPDPPVDFVQLDGKSGLDNHFQGCKPFYRRKWLGLF